MPIGLKTFSEFLFVLEEPRGFLQEICPIVFFFFFFLHRDSEKKALPSPIQHPSPTSPQSIVFLCFQGLLECSFKIVNLPPQLTNLYMLLSYFQSLKLYILTKNTHGRGICDPSFWILVFTTVSRNIPM